MTAQGIPASVMTTYYVVPMKGETRVPPLGYFTADWMGVINNVLQSSSAKNRTDFVRIVQPTYEQMQENGVDLNAVDTELTLFAGVAKTLNGSYDVPNLLSASNGALIVPVARTTTRGLVLIFTRQRDGVMVDLVASSDPLIKNGADDLPGTLR